MSSGQPTATSGRPYTSMIKGFGVYFLVVETFESCLLTVFQIHPNFPCTRLRSIHRLAQPVRQEPTQVIIPSTKRRRLVTAVVERTHRIQTETPATQTPRPDHKARFDVFGLSRPLDPCMRRKCCRRSASVSLHLMTNPRVEIARQQGSL
jgi:hypothetical protein